MNFNNAIPQPDDLVSASQAPLLSNNATVKQSFDINHAPMNSSRQGKHNIVTLRQQAADPGAGEIESVLYTRDRYGTPQIKIKKGTNAGNITTSFYTPFPSVRAWVKFEGVINLGPGPFACPINKSYNIASVDQTNLGFGDIRYTVTLTNALTFPTNNAFYLATAQDENTAIKSTVISVAANQFVIRFTRGFGLNFVGAIIANASFFVWGDT